MPSRTLTDLMVELYRRSAGTPPPGEFVDAVNGLRNDYDLEYRARKRGA